MSGEIVLKIKKGAFPGKEFFFRHRTLCTVGRSEDCYLQFPQADVSRRHCLLDIDPPHARIRDLGSRNGTYVNGALIGHRLTEQTPDTGDLSAMPEWELQAGDEIRIGGTVLAVSILDIEEPAAAMLQEVGV